jgi:hypothetical protein
MRMGMNKKILIGAILLVLLLPAGAQCFENLFLNIDTYVYNNRLVPAQNGYLMTGDDDWNYGCIVKVDATGNCVWTRTYPDYGIRDGVMIADGYMLCAYFFPATQPAFMKVDFNGNCVWTRTTADENTYPTSIAKADSGGFVMAGYGFGANFESSLYVEKTDANGDCVWAKSYYTDINARKIINSGDGGYVVCGGDSCCYGFFIKLNADGSENFSISTYYDTGYYDAWFDDVAYTGDGYLVTGQASKDGTFDFSGVLAMKIDMTGNTKNEKTYDWGRYNSGQSLCTTEGGADYGYLIAGPDCVSGTATTDINTFVMQVDANGNCKTVNAHHDTSTYKYSIYYPSIANIGSGNYIFSAYTASDVWPNGKFYNASGKVKPVVSLPVPGGESAKISYACPQPAADIIKFVYPLESAADVTIYIYNFANRLVGKNVSKEQPDPENATTTVDIKKLPAGVYFYQVVAKHADGKITRYTPDKFMVKK